MRALDWSKTPLGPVESWPESLRTCVRVILTSRQPMFVWWGDQLINLYNDAYKQIVGGKHPAALGQPASVVWREIWSEVSVRVAQTMQGNEGTYDEALLLIMDRNGYEEETYYTFSYSPVPNEHGGTGGIICANTDDTDRIVGQRQLALLSELGARAVKARSWEEACTLSAQALATAPRDIVFALIYIVDADGQGATLAGTTNIAPGHPAAPQSISFEEPSPLWRVADAVRSREQLRVADLKSRFADLPQGAWNRSPELSSIVPIASSGPSGHAGALVVGLNPYRLYDDGYRDFLTLIASQISASLGTADAYAAERRKAETLAELDRAKTTFFSNVSHEFRTPLTLMIGPIEDALSRQGGALSGRNLATVYRNSIRLLKLVNALLDFSRIEAGRAQASYEPTDLSALTTELASAFRSAVERAGLAFDVNCKALGEPIFVDHDMWEKVVLNLLSNALKFTFEGSISVSLSDARDHVQLVVKDTGTGIPSRELPHLFERFHRVQGARSRTHEGSGIGLALTHELVRLHGGAVRVESEVGRGTTFTVQVPKGFSHLPPERVGGKRELASTVTGAAPYVEEALRWLPEAEGEGDTASASAASPGLTEVGPAGADPSVRILLADDNADMREYVGRLLRERYGVQTVGDGVAALAAARAAPPHLVLTDVMMPGLDGFGLLRALRADPVTRSVPVIMLSARAGEESRVEGLEAGADDYLPKPFSARELLARVATHLQLAGLRRASEAARERLNELFVQAPVAVAVLSGDDLLFEVANSTFCELVGRRELVGEPARRVLPELATHPIFVSLEAALRSGQPMRTSEALFSLTRNGSRVDAYFDYSVQPIRDGSSATSRAMVVATEVTEQVLARRRIDSLRAAAESASRAKDEFLSTLSHELRTPLNAIVGWSGLLRSGAIPANQREKALETVERNARVQARLIEEMLDLSRIEQGKLVLSVGPVEMVRVVEAAIEAVRPAADAKGVRLQPVLDSHAAIVGDADRLQQIVWNLLSNAIKFTAKGGRVQIRLHRAQSFVEVAVADDGQGITTEFLPHVFDRFRQGDATFARKAGGLGLGLAIARSLVELHGGNVAAASDGEGRGATFTVRLPTAPLRADTVRQQQDSHSTADVAGSFDCPPILKGLSLLVVDDEPDTRELLKFVIGQCEASVTTAASAAEALSLLERERFDVLVSDVGMPEQDGYALVRALRRSSRNENIPALALTAYARGEDRTQALKAGFNMHLAKPIDPSELLVVLATLVRDNRLGRAAANSPVGP
jgi:signal transduction histidine kinase